MVLLLHYDFPQHQVLSRLSEHGPAVASHLFKHAVRQPAKAQDVNVHDPPVRMHHHEVLLRLHRKLLRHDHQIITVRMPE